MRMRRASCQRAVAGGGGGIEEEEKKKLRISLIHQSRCFFFFSVGRHRATRACVTGDIFNREGVVGEKKKKNSVRGKKKKQACDGGDI